MTLSAWSALLFTALAMTVVNEAARGGFFRVFCDPYPHVLSSPHALIALFYLNYLTKYYVSVLLRTRPDSSSWRTNACIASIGLGKSTTRSCWTRYFLRFAAEQRRHCMCFIMLRACPRH